MSEITLTINGKQCKGKQGDTVLDVCLANGVDLPTLCHYKGLVDVGACRLCLVDIEKERRPVPACTFPARDGIVVITDNPKIEKYRRLLLELLFTERNHLCGYCVASGDCDLQRLAYRYQMDNARYQYAWPNQTVDSSHQFIVMDHARCVLCGRCIRTCDEITGSHTLDFGKRGWKTNVYVDINQPLGESSCISCGGCFQACPTGAIFSKASAYKGKPEECTSVGSVCAVCGVGCDITGLAKNNKLVKIVSPDMSKPRGILCEMGRFEPLYQEAPRVTTPMKRNAKGELASCSYEDAFDAIAKKLGSIEAVAGLASGKADTEALNAFSELMNKTLGSKMIDTLDGDDFRTVSQGITKFDGKAGLNIEANLEDILTADTILLIGAHPVKTHPVVASYIMRATSKNNAKLIVLDPLRNPFTFRASVWLKPAEGKKDLAIKALGNAILSQGVSKEKAKFAAAFKDVDVKKAAKDLGIDASNISKAAEILAQAKDGIVIYGSGVLQYKDADMVANILGLASLIAKNADKPKAISLKRYGNSRGAWELGIGNSKNSVISELAKGKVKGVYVLLADDLAASQALPDNFKGVDFAVVQASYLSPVTAKADVVLPSLLWTESKGVYTTLDGIKKTTAPMVKANGDIKTDADTLKEIARHLKK
jgi:NADH dehydrogenase/NADH:ubiquinone oxidoreductase subunit G